MDSRFRGSAFRFEMQSRLANVYRKDMLEDEAVEVLLTLQTSLPAVAQKLCSYPNSKDRFITLGLGQ
jgi:hypothetical protein